MKILSALVAIVVAVLLSYALGASAGTPDVQPSKPDTSAPIKVPCDGGARLITGSFQPESVVTRYRVSFEARGQGRMLWTPAPYGHRSEIAVLCSQTLGVYCRYEYITDYVAPNMQPTEYFLSYWAGPCASGQRTDLIRNYSVEILGPPAQH